jgi:hypothetical protein
MSTQNTGGPAFPHLGLYPGADGNLHPAPTMHGGMTLRDWFAGQALAGLLALETPHDLMARDAYILADAMIKERAK